jgi:hypothetical protein
MSLSRAPSKIISRTVSNRASSWEIVFDAPKMMNVMPWGVSIYGTIFMILLDVLITAI